MRDNLVLYLVLYSGGQGVNLQYGEDQHASISDTSMEDVSPISELKFDQSRICLGQAES